jgi:hypothetical protein
MTLSELKVKMKLAYCDFISHIGGNTSLLYRDSLWFHHSLINSHCIDFHNNYIRNKINPNLKSFDW